MANGLLLNYLRPFRWRLLLLLILLLGSIGLQLIGPQILRQFLDAAQAGAAARALIGVGAIFFLVVLGQKIVSLLSVYASEDLGWAATNGLRADLAAHCLRLDMGFHKTHTPGELIERIDGDVGLLAESFSSLIVQVLGNGLLIVGVVLLLFREDGRFGLIGLVYVFLNFLFIQIIQRPVVRVWREVRAGFANLFSYLEERLTGTEDIRSNGGEASILAGLYPLMATVNQSHLMTHLFGWFTFSSSILLYRLAWIATLALAGSAFLQGQMTIGAVFMLAFYIGLLESPIKHVRRQMERLQRALAGMSRINEFLQLEPQVKERPSAVLPDSAPSVTFDAVTFAYDDQLPGETTTQRQVLQDVSFHLEAGKVLGLLGRTGSGKTTLTRLLFRLYDADAGGVTLNGVDIRDVSLGDLRRRVGMATQDVQLFAATVRDNLTLFHNYAPDVPPISDEAITAALTTLGLDSWLRDLPDGLDTLLLSGGQGLSAGQAQLLALTRLFLRDPRLIILDEASSRLDPATERLLERAIDRLLAGRTAIIIAHRLQTVRRADDILILENGRLLEQGPRSTLAANPDSHFAHLLRTGLEGALV